MGTGLTEGIVEDGKASACDFGDIGAQVCGTYQPTFLYELLWNVAVGVALLILDRRLRLGRGTVFALYVMGYTLGRVWIEMLRRDDANHILGLRLNVWTSIIVFVAGLVLFLRRGGFRAQRETTPYRADAEVGSDAEGRDELPAGDENEVSARDGHDD